MYIINYVMPVYEKVENCHFIFSPLKHVALFMTFNSFCLIYEHF